MADRYCFYCDADRERTPCEACGHQTWPKEPVQDAYYAECCRNLRAVLATKGTAV